MVDEVKALVFEKQTDLLSEPNFSGTGLVLIDFMSFARSR
jgi:hypothetical protein